VDVLKSRASYIMFIPSDNGKAVKETQDRLDAMGLDVTVMGCKGKHVQVYNILAGDRYYDRRNQHENNPAQA